MDRPANGTDYSTHIEDFGETDGWKEKRERSNRPLDPGYRSKRGGQDG